MNDNDLGSWTYDYDGASDLTSQTDDNQQGTAMTYDQLGRMTQRSEADLVSNWTYDTAANGVGLLAQATTSGAATPASGYTRTYTYDTLSRPSTISEAFNKDTKQITFSYDAQGRYADSTSTDSATGKSMSATRSDNAAGYPSAIANNTADRTTRLSYSIDPEDQERS